MPLTITIDYRNSYILYVGCIVVRENWRDADVGKRDAGCGEIYVKFDAKNE